LTLAVGGFVLPLLTTTQNSLPAGG